MICSTTTLFKFFKAEIKKADLLCSIAKNVKFRCIMKLYILIFVIFTATNLVVYAKPIQSVEVLQNTTLEEIIEKHLDSIGTRDALNSVSSRVMIGSVKSNFLLGGDRNFNGVSQFASEGDKTLLAMIFDSNEYLYEKAGFDGSSFYIGLPEGKRTDLGNFFKTQDIIFKKGLIGGTLSSSWILLNSDKVKDQLKYIGMEKINDIDLHKIRFSPITSSNITITLYTRADNYQHIFSRYNFSTISRMSNNPTLAVRQREIRYTLTEQFGDFKVVEKLTLPTSYIIDLTVENAGIKRQTWTINFVQFFYNNSLDAKSFKVS